MPQNEVAEAERLHDGAREVNRLVFGEGVVEGHEIPHLLIRYDSTTERLASERAAL